jgi:predicted RNase H-like nuclease (RuvC/YqgF family)
MDPGVIVALIGVGSTAAGGVVAWVRSRFKARETVYEKSETQLQARIDQLEREIKLLEQAADLKDETLADLRSQRDRLQISAEITDRFYRQLPQLRRDPGEQHG